MNKKKIKSNRITYQETKKTLYIYGKPETHSRISNYVYENGKYVWTPNGHIVEYVYRPILERMEVICLDEHFVIYVRHYRRINTTQEIRYNSGFDVDYRNEKIKGRQRQLPNSWDDIPESRRSKRGWKDNTKCRKQWMVNLV